MALALALTACEAADRAPAESAGGDSAAVIAAQPAAPPTLTPVIDTLPGGERFRPAGFSDSVTLWGIEGGRLSRYDLRTGRAEPQAASAWSVHAAPGVVAWRNEQGAWVQRNGAEAIRVAGNEPVGEFEGPPDVLLASDGRQALLSWRAEWSLHHELLDSLGTRRPLQVQLPGYMALGAHQWLDGERVLFTAVATAPVGGQPEYRESGWRGDLAVLSLNDGSLRRVTSVPDGTFLRPTGRFRGGILVSEHDSSGIRAHWRYDPADWSRRPVEMPPGRAFAAGDAAVAFQPAEADRWRALLFTGDTLALDAPADPDLAPAISADGRAIVLRLGTAGAAKLVRIRLQETTHP